MKIIKKISLLLFAVSLLAGCKKFLDVNSDPTSPQEPDIASLMVPVTSIMSKMMGVDIITVGQYIQNFSHITTLENFDIHGGNASGASANGLWRSFYAQQGTSINLIIKKGIQEQKWDYVGAATALRAWGLLQATTYFGEMPYHEAWNDTRYTFAYNDQPTIYKVVDSLCVVALDYLRRTDGDVNSVAMARGDQVYGGDRSKWIKFVYGIRARRWQHLSNKPEYNADSVIAFVNQSFTSNADNFYIRHTATRNDDTNPFGAARDNLSVRRQSKFIVQLLDGTTFYNNTFLASRDPRIRGMLTVSPDTTTITANMPTLNGGYRFLTPGVGDPNTAALALPNSQGLPTNPVYRQRVSTLYADSAILNPSLNTFNSSVGKYIFRGTANFPIMTYHELQFIKAEAAFQSNKATSHAAYLEGISSHFDFIDFFNGSSNPGISPVVSQRAAYLASPAVKTMGTLTITDIMLQKYIGSFGWNMIETWVDLRRYHYLDLDPATGAQVYKGFIFPSFSSNNQGPKPAYRYRPTNFSEFDWNFDELRKLGAVNIDYHTYEMWFSKP